MGQTAPGNDGNVVMASTQPGAEVRRRPRDRKQQIVAAATTLFRRYGYGNVSTGDIAQKVGITPGALYRHFPSKQDILGQAIDSVVDDVLTPVAPADGDLDDVVGALSRSLAKRRDLGVLWHRECRHLEHKHRRRVQLRLQGLLDRTAVDLAALRPDLTPEDAYLLAVFMVSTLTSPSYHAAELPPEQETDLLQCCASAVATTPLLAGSEHSPAHPARVGISHLSRREGIVAAATRLFFERGYQATTVDDVGAAVGVSGAAVYKHFGSKSELLAATISRAAEPLQLGMATALSEAQTAHEALTRALDEYIAFATVHHHLVGILVSEATNLPDTMRHTVRRQQATYVAEWVRLLRESRPELDAAQARYIVHAVLTTINDATRTDRIRAYPDLAQRLRQIGVRLLGVEL
ncbi:TetR/AcrR family transcriptional regulator [Nocardioides daeguensis]|uniref:TetR/AcrR family transcriptional regulator n=1 Tax=Nocardioides daeguensis TaxID=908359 RepID=A0ABP6UZP7_9ACTN|nr:TetR/AcrR family transcriptional regulator [Nocardioides daeguensis]MBV6728774.1 TetR/AcrR family transcriptional regulator [Nocardioides daeguensis]MCR1773616.1 TetR/AcrR family transcriptional regulator [Nocardioides daeguensis]